MNTKNVNKLVIVPLVFILVLTLSITYALFTKEVNTNNRKITLSSVDKYIGIYGTNKNNIELNKDYTFTIENRGTTDAAYQLYLEAEGNIDLSKITYTISGDATKTGTLSDTYLLRDNLNCEQIHTITIRLTSTEITTYIGSIKVSMINILDKTPPVLTLSKDTYVEGFNNWVLSNATISSNILTLSSNSSTAHSEYYNANGEPWYITFDAYTTAKSEYFSNIGKGGIHVTSSYYNASKENVKSNNDYSGNGRAEELTLNTWVNNLKWNGYAGHGPNVKYVLVSFHTGDTYSMPITKIRNFRFHGQFPNSFFDIMVDAKDSDSSVKSIKYASGNQTIEYFKNNGQAVNNNVFRVSSNGTYTVYAENRDGYATVSTIEITKIQ